MKWEYILKQARPGVKSWFYKKFGNKTLDPTIVDSGKAEILEAIQFFKSKSKLHFLTELLVETPGEWVTKCTYI